MTHGNGASVKLDAFTELDLYAQTVRRFGYPTRTWHDDKGQMVIDGPFTPLTTEQRERFDAHIAEIRESNDLGPEAFNAR